MTEENKSKEFRGNPVEESQATTLEWPKERALGDSTSQGDEMLQ